MSTELIYGIHAVSALLERTPERFIEVWALKGRDDDRLQPLLAELDALGLKVQSVNRKTPTTRQRATITKASWPG